MQYHIKDFSRHTSSSSSRPRTAAFHAVNRGSNPLEDAKNLKELEKILSPFCLSSPHYSPQKIYILNQKNCSASFKQFCNQYFLHCRCNAIFLNYLFSPPCIKLT